MLRLLLERTLRGSVFPRRLPPQFGRRKIYVSASAGLKYVFKPMATIDPDLLAFASDYVRPGHVVWDLGANIGLFTFAAAQMAGPGGRVISIEADTWLIGLLRKSISLSPESSAPITLVPVAISDRAGLATFHLAQRSRATNHLAGFGSTQTGGVKESHTVVTVTLDWLAQQVPPPNVLKIDVEGAESLVLAGAQEMIAKHRPVILCEINGDASPWCSDFFKKNGYRMFDAGKPKAERVELDAAPYATLALPS